MTAPLTSPEQSLPTERTPAPLAMTGWRARLELEFDVRHGRSRLASARHRGPLLVQRCFHPETDGTAHVYLLHPPGGIAGGDRLELAVAMRGESHALITTPAATKVYRSAGEQSEQRVDLHVGAGAVLEWLPQETIVFDGAAARTTTRIEVEPGGRVLGWEITCLGRTGAGERFQRGRWLQRIEVHRGGRPLWIERFAAAAGDPVLERPWGLAGFPVTGTLFCVTGGDAADRELKRPGARGATADTETARRIRETLSAQPSLPPGELFAASALTGIIVCRYLGSSTARARTCLAVAWDGLRRAALGRGAHAPRIWAT